MKMGAKLLFAVPLMFGAILAPVAACAQTDQVIVMTCTFDRDPAAPETVTLNLAARTGTEEFADGLKNNTAITDISDQRIVWLRTENPSIRVDPSAITTGTLNRYTGRLTLTTPGGFFSTATCQRQQKQF